jgi:hypothetical protein
MVFYVYLPLFSVYIEYLCGNYPYILFSNPGPMTPSPVIMYYPQVGMDPEGIAYGAIKIHGIRATAAFENQKQEATRATARPVDWPVSAGLPGPAGGEDTAQVPAGPTGSYPGPVAAGKLL